MDNQQAKALLEKYRGGLCTDEEKAWVESWYLSTDHNEDKVSHEEIEAAMQEVRQNLPARDLYQRRLWPRIAAVAASVAIIVSAGGYFILHKAPVQSTAQNQVHDIAPGGNKAILTLANGRRISLTDTKNGKLAQQGNSAVSKTADGEIIYKAGDSNNDATVYNTMSVPRGGQYHLTLADGTNVWLNAASSINYPTAFNSDERKVEVTGEAYFEVTHNKAKPFRVVSNGQTIEVLGTHFDIMAYSDEKVVRTTLLEGAVKVSRNNATEYLKPGDQAQAGSNAIKVTHHVDLEEAVAWKNGYFIFNDEDLESVMRKVSRWYDVEVVYKDEALKTEGFGGRSPRYSSVTELLETLEGLKLAHFKVEGRRIVVSRY